MLSKSLVSLLLNAIPLFVTIFRYRHRFWCWGQSMKQFRPGYFKTYQLLKKGCGNFGVLGITRLLDLFARVLRDGKQIRENDLLRHLLTLKHSHHFNFCLEFDYPFLLCSDGFTLINLKLSCWDHFILSFLPTIIWSLTHSFYHLWPIYLCQTSISLTLSLSVAWLCKFLLKVFQYI